MITLVFGAGASFGSGGCSPSNPPLGDKLFGELQKLGGVFAQLDDSQRKVFLDNGFEAGMATIANISTEIIPLQKELACYISGFHIRPDNSYARLFNKIKAVIDKVTIATLNYDLLIEQSLRYHHIVFDYEDREGAVPLLKIHGSSNFLPELGTLKLSGNTFIGCVGFVNGLKTNAALNQEEIRAWCNNPENSDIPPVLAMYNKEKRVVVNKGLVAKIQNQYSDSIHKSTHIVVVGTKFLEHDAHVWKPISDSGSNVLVVDPCPESIQSWVKSSGKENVKILSKSFEDAVWDIAKFVRQAAF